jgi:Methyltransferase domain
MTSPCPLCSSVQTFFYIEAYRRTYLECDDCGLTFLTPQERLDPEAERTHYLTHQNDPRDSHYRDFLDRLAIPLTSHLKPGARGLDVGSGPGPTLSLMLQERGFPTQNYDPYFAPDVSVLETTYDFITATEVVEHFYNPGQEFRRLDALLNPSGYLGIMTELVRDDRPFDKWHYPRDPTHVSFYRARSMEWIAKSFNYVLEIPRPNVVLFRKPSPAPS